MTRGRFLIGGAAAIFVAAALALGGALREAPSASVRVLPASPASLLTGFSSAGTPALIQRLEDELDARPDDADALALLGLAYQQRARETFDASLYAQSEAALRRALRLTPSSETAVSGLASLALSRHRFREALALARRAHALAPASARTYGAVGDALVELGRYREAFAAFDRMASLKPGLAAYARVSYARELLGRPRAAIDAMRLALDASHGRGEPAAWAHVELGKLHFGLGKLARARRYFQSALLAFPGYPYALEQLARVEAARGRDARAIALARRAAETIPLPQFAATLGDLYARAGRQREAREQYHLVGAVERLLRANGVRTDLEVALFKVDHGIRLAEALAEARRAHAQRPSIEADDVLAWALVRNGRCGEALRYSKRALRLGTLDAPKMFHRGMIERCLGHEAASRAWLTRALETNPHFSLLWAPVAQRLVAS